MSNFSVRINKQMFLHNAKYLHKGSSQRICKYLRRFMGGNKRHRIFEKEQLPCRQDSDSHSVCFVTWY